MKFLWGDDAEDFWQERWLDENGVFHPDSPFIFTAFQVKKEPLENYTKKNYQVLSEW